MAPAMEKAGSNILKFCDRTPAAPPHVYEISTVNKLLISSIGGSLE